MADIVVCGYAMRHPVAGNMLAFVHYLAGFHRLGHRVAYVENAGWDDACFDPVQGTSSDDPTTGVRQVRALLELWGCDDIPTWFVDLHGRCHGGSLPSLRAELRRADLLVDLGGVCDLDELSLCERHVLVDMDPGFTQAGRFAGVGSLERYDALFTYGVNLGAPDCPVPLDAHTWMPTVPPVIVAVWEPLRDRPTRDVFTTVANLDAYGSITLEGVTYGQKLPSLSRMGDLPRRASAGLEIAIDSASPDDRAALAASGWLLADGRAVSADIDTYADHLSGSLGEFSVAKEAYVGLHTGWFSDRSVCYLAAARPVIVEDTGFARHHRLDGGVVPWSDLDSAASAIDDVLARPAHHRHRACELAHDVFGHDVVLPALLERAR